jgi:hypothetical protein
VQARVALLVAVALAGCAARRPSGLTLLPPERPVEAWVASARAHLAEGRRLRATEGRRAALAELDAALFDAERALSAANPLVAERLIRRRPTREIFAPLVRADLDAAAVWLEALHAAKEARGTLHLFDAQELLGAGAARIIALDRGAGWGAADRVLGQLLADLPVGAGLDLVNAQEHFEAAIVIAPGYLPTRVLYALHWATRAREEDTFRRLLDEVVRAGDHSPPPGAASENAAAIATARALLPPR